MTPGGVVPAKPVPVPDATSRGYWEAAARGVLAIARCEACGTFVHPVGIVCRACNSAEPTFAFEPVSGAGTIRSWTVMRDTFLPGFAADVPYVLVDVELDEQADLRMVGRLVDGPLSPLRLGLRVGIMFDEPAPGVGVPAFALAEPA